VIAALLRRCLVTFVATVGIVLAGLGTGPMPRNSAAEVASRVRLCDQAWARGDVAALDGLLARRYVHADERGKVRHRADWLADAGKPRNVSVSCDDLAVQVHGDVAVVTGSDLIATPERAEVRRFTQVWIKRDAAWLRAAFHAVASPPAPPLRPRRVPPRPPPARLPPAATAARTDAGRSHGCGKLHPLHICQGSAQGGARYLFLARVQGVCP
jgi:hypothetical protein